MASTAASAARRADIAFSQAWQALAQAAPDAGKAWTLGQAGRQAYQALRDSGPLTDAQAKDVERLHRTYRELVTRIRAIDADNGL